MTDNEKLIEEAAKAIWSATDALTWEQTGEDMRDSCRVEARAALAVFEKAHTPTDDEREAQGWREAELYASADGDARDDFMTGWRTADRLRHSEVADPPSPQFKVGDVVGSGSQTFVVTEVSGYRPHPRLPDEFRYYVVGDEEFVRCGVWEHYLKLVKSAPEPQGEPSDARVLAALEAYWGYPDGYSRGQFEKMRAALRAASATTEPLIECPHWAPGRITLRRGCTACAAVTEQGENRYANDGREVAPGSEDWDTAPIRYHGNNPAAFEAGLRSHDEPEADH